ncbi:MAG TPA: STAS domain-containing protein [Gemmataceae bacterium]|nr:STAS domain-containing protein [Gemmataceae bacterium]
MNLQSSDDFLEVQTREDAVIARFTRQMSLAGEVVEEVAERFISLLADSGQQRLLVDFGNVDSLSSFMLGQLVKLNRTAEAAGKKFGLFNLRTHIREILDVSRLNLILSLYQDEADALRGS